MKRRDFVKLGGLAAILGAIPSALLTKEDLLLPPIKDGKIVLDLDAAQDRTALKSYLNKGKKPPHPSGAFSFFLFGPLICIKGLMTDLEHQFNQAVPMLRDVAEEYWIDEITFEQRPSLVLIESKWKSSPDVPDESAGFWQDYGRHVLQARQLDDYRKIKDMIPGDILANNERISIRPKPKHWNQKNT